MNKQTLTLSSAFFALAAFFLTAAPGHAQYSAPVKVNNSVNQPVPVTVAPEPFTATCIGFKTCDFILPEGKRLVIESVTGDANLAIGSNWLVRLATTYASGRQGNNSSSGWSVTMPTITMFSNSTFTFVAMNNRTYLLADSGFGAALQITNVGGGGISQCETVVSGYLIPTT